MTSFYLYFPGSILIYVKSLENLEVSKILLNAYVPGVELDLKSDRVPDVVIEYKQANDKKLVQEEGLIHIYDNWGKEFPLDFYHLLYSVVRVELLKRDLFSVHAACIGKSNYILLVGHSGVGKTSIVLELLKNNSTRLFSSNKTVVNFNGGFLEAVAGTTTITANINDINKHNPEDKIEILTYGDRSAVTTNKYINDRGQIQAIVLVGLNDGVEENYIITPASALHKLYGYFFDTVNADTIVCDGQDVYVGTASLGTQKYLARNLSNVLSKIPTYSIKGSMDFVCNAITKL